MTEPEVVEEAGAPEYTETPGLVDGRFAKAMESYLGNRSLAESFAKLAEADKQLIEVLVREANAPKTVTYKGARVTQAEGRKGSSKIEPKLLLKLGVDADVIKKATVTGEPGKPSIRITRAGEEG